LLKEKAGAGAVVRRFAGRHRRGVRLKILSILNEAGAFCYPVVERDGN
jgi:hypothetical protein